MRNIVFAALSLFALQAEAATNWQNLLDQSGGSRVMFGVALEGPEPYRRNYNTEFAPASNAKIFTTAALLDALGSDYRYPTQLRWTPISESRAAHLTLVGNGDPSWGMSEFGDGLKSRVTAMADELYKAGVRTVEGDVTAVAGDYRWNQINFPFGWKNSDPLSCGGSLAQSFNLNINCATLVVSSNTKASFRESGVPTPLFLNISKGSSTNIDVKLKTFEGGEIGYEVSGTWKSGSRSFALPVWNARDWVRNLFSEALKSRGITFVPARVRPRGEDREITFLSRPLSELIKPFMKNSINFMGDAFLKTLALTERTPLQPNLLEEGLQKLREYLLSLGVPDEFRLYDGCGLSRMSRITPNAMLIFLEKAKGRDFRALWNSLPIAGVDGTLRSRMKGTAAAGVLRAKTGTLDGVYNLAGYVPDGNAFVPFLMLTKTTTANASVARGAQNRVGAKFAQVLKATAPLEQIVPFPYVPEHAGMDDQ